MDREHGVGGQGVGHVLTHLLDAGVVEGQHDVELDVGGVRIGIDPVRVFHIIGPAVPVGAGVRNLLLPLPLVVAGGRAQGSEPVLQHVEAEDLPLGAGLAVHGLLPFEVGVLRVEVGDVLGILLVGIQVAGRRRAVDVPVARLDLVDEAGVHLDAELDLRVDGRQDDVVVRGIGRGVVVAQRAPDHVRVVGVDRPVAEHQEEVLAVDRSLFEDDLDILEFRQVLERVEARDGILPVQRGQRVGDVGQDDQGAVGVGLGGYLDGALRLVDDGRDAGDGLVGDEPAFVVGVFQLAQARHLLLVAEITAVELVAVLVEDEDVQVVYVGLVRPGSLRLGADLHVQRQRGAEVQRQVDRRAFRQAETREQRFPDAGSCKQEDREEECQA